MGRALYSQSYAPAIIREPSPSPYEKWSISNPFDPDSEEFFEGAQYEAFLPAPASTDSSADHGPTTIPRVYINTARNTTTRDGDFVVRPSRVRISNEDPTSIVSTSPSNTMPPPMTIPNFRDLTSAVDVDSSRPAPSPMAVETDAEDPMRILASFMNRTVRGEGEEAHLNVSEILRHLDEQWRRELRENQSQEDGYRPQRYLPPLSYPSSDSGSSGPSSRADSPSSPIFFPSPPSDTLPSPPPMSRENVNLDALPSQPSHHFAFDFDEELVLERELRRLASLDESPVSDPVLTQTEPSIPISQTPPRALPIRHRTSSGFGHDIGLDMSPPPSVSPRLYNWSRTRSESRLHRDSVSSSPAVFGQRARGNIPITERRH